MNYRILYRTNNYQSWKPLPNSPVSTDREFLNDFIKKFKRRENSQLEYQFQIVEYK